MVVKRTAVQPRRALMEAALIAGAPPEPRRSSWRSAVVVAVVAVAIPLMLTPMSCPSPPPSPVDVTPTETATIPIGPAGQ